MHNSRLAAILSLAAVLCRAGNGGAAPESMGSVPAALTINDAVQFALANNPELMAVRQQHGIAAAGIVIAQTYPFNPNYEARLRPSNGPGVTNHFDSEHTILLELELRGQGKLRRREARATLSRTDWEIATQELTIAIRTMRAYESVIYREQKLRLLEETERLDRQAADQVTQLVQAGRLRGPDLILARAELDDVRAQLTPARVLLSTSWSDLRRALGVVDGDFALIDRLDAGVDLAEPEALLGTALARRPELGTRRAAIDEAQARLKLACANRLGNIAAGPTYEYDPTQVNLIGATLTIPVPLFNRHQGEIQQRRAECARANLDLRQAEIDIRQDVRAALDHLRAAEVGMAIFPTQILPNLQTSLRQMDQLLLQGDPSVDVLRVIEVRRRLIHARDSYLDSLFDLQQARADVVAAAGDLTLIQPAPRPGR